MGPRSLPRQHNCNMSKQPRGLPRRDIPGDIPGDIPRGIFPGDIPGEYPLYRILLLPPVGLPYWIRFGSACDTIDELWWWTLPRLCRRLVGTLRLWLIDRPVFRLSFIHI